MVRVLLTGFGPFPGAPINPSAWLAEALPERLSCLGGEIYARVLPTEWKAVEGLAQHFHETLQPHVTIHFGLSQTAREFRIERSAYNRASPRRDASGALPRDRRILAEGAERLDTSLQAAILSAHLREHGIPAASSRSAGRYLCNFLYYLSLARAIAETSPSAVLFVHIPPLAAHGGPLSEAEMLGAAETIVSLTIAHANGTSESVTPHAAQRRARR
jgi:pyroglutamyl-peptidase